MVYKLKKSLCNILGRYVTFEKNAEGNDVPKLKQISLFPVIPMAGIKLEF